MLQYNNITINEVNNLIKSKFLERENWLLADERNYFLHVTENDCHVAVVEYRHIDEKCIFIEMIEVKDAYKGKKYSDRIIEHLQNVYYCIEEVPIEYDCSLFERNGFMEKENSIFRWNRGIY